MSKRQFKSNASSSRAFAGSPAFGFGSNTGSSTFGSASSSLSYVTEPPDLSSISDPHVAVAFKNLSKKDGTTKSKALEELQSYVSATEHGLDDAVVDAWVKIYPRTSIDTSRRVRQLAHSVQGQICAAYGKKIVKHMPAVVGAWLAGCYDNDRTVSRAAQDSIAEVFSTPEKLRNLRKAYQETLLQYSLDILDKETPQTLSDERMVSVDEAEAKYSRVVAASLALITSLLSQLDEKERSKSEAQYDVLIADGKVWNFISHGDVAIRRAVCKLLTVCISQKPEAISDNLNQLSTSFLSRGLEADQTGSSNDLAGCLLVLTTTYPAIWTDLYSGKKSVIHRFRHFLKRGSQLGPSAYWTTLTGLFRVIPKSLFLHDLSDTGKLIDSLHSGITRKDEPRLNLGAAFKAYVNIVGSIGEYYPEEGSATLFEEKLLPIVNEYIFPHPDTSEWSLPVASAQDVIQEAFSLNKVCEQVIEKWQEISGAVSGHIKASLPEQARDFEKSQAALIRQGQRWAQVQHILQRKTKHPSSASILDDSLESVISTATSTLESRNGKPYGAAGVIEATLRISRSEMLEHDRISQVLEDFASLTLPRLFSSPSMPKLASILYLLHDTKYFSDAWRATLSFVMDGGDETKKLAAVRTLITSPDIPDGFLLASESPVLQLYLLQKSNAAIQGHSDWSLIGESMKKEPAAAASATVDEILAELTKALSINGHEESAFLGFQEIIKHNPHPFQNYASKPEGSSLLSRVLYLTESPDDQIADQASKLNLTIKSIVSKDAGLSGGNLIAKTIQDSWNDASSSSVSVQTLAELGIEQFKTNSESQFASTLIPDDNVWSSAMEPFLQMAPPVQLATIHPLGGTVFLVESRSGGRRPRHSNIPRDFEGLSVALRMVWYVTKMASNQDFFAAIGEDRQSDLFSIVSIGLCLANDNLSLLGANNFWSIYTPEVETQMTVMISDMQTLINSWLESAERVSISTDAEDPHFLKTSFSTALANATGSSTLAYYNAQVYATHAANFTELHGWQSRDMEGFEKQLSALRRAKDTLPLSAFLAGNKAFLSNSQLAQRLCNELVADLTGMSIDQKADEILRSLVVLNVILTNHDNIEGVVATQRIIFFVKKAISWLEAEHIAQTTQSEVYKAFTILLPLMGDIYGSHWKEILDSLTQLWSRENSEDTTKARGESVPLANSSLKLYRALRRSAASEDANDDLVDALKDTHSMVSSGLLNLLQAPQPLPDDHDQPQMITNELLGREMSDHSVDQVSEPYDLCPLIFSESGSKQLTAYNILHQKIPAAQEQVSFDAALDKKTARLPEELLSLILEAPTTDALQDADFERTTPLRLRGYLLAWVLIFDHFKNASFQVKTDYIANIKDETNISGLLDFTFDFLGHADARPIDASKMDISNYEPDLADTPKKDVQHLLTHLYYLCLKHIPSLTKAWWIDCKSRQTVTTVERWTVKFISPLIIADALQSVSEWAATPDVASDHKLVIKVNARAKDVTASYEVDEQNMVMALRFPPNFPLGQAVAESVNRVAVDEKKWQSWIRITQGVIAFSNNNIVDGLTAWRKNVTGALKGQTECAICYSIVSSDKQLPTKRCSTCKNLFHSSCLFKWFKTSNGSSCPLCRNAFNYG
ncbi:hypothetical protein K402DRAFT_456495 [Aulographum hederae CBS 113979]|uniref:E3 ubiquitin-protein ligase listerin n=1 Tax=Aulographum hederae CBS 113979 TaxID=1176131 RepID=A0A6G1GRZ2_9PEZI|nr:hypothetical protein K402DRAFT_456495 [Aulographum hederae CBS 113979]